MDQDEQYVIKQEFSIKGVLIVYIFLTETFP